MLFRTHSLHFSMWQTPNTERPLSLYMISSAQPSSPSWHTVPRLGLDHVQLQSVRALTLFLTRCKRFGFCDNNLQTTKADDAFFQRIINNNLYVLQIFFTGITYRTILDPDRTTNYWSLKLLTWANVILLSVYCTKTAIDIFTFYRFIFFTLFKLRVSTFY